jgi:hypothetical protein
VHEAAHAIVTLAEPERLNALSAGLVHQLRVALDKLCADPELRAIVVRRALLLHDLGVRRSGRRAQGSTSPRLIA